MAPRHRNGLSRRVAIFCSHIVLTVELDLGMILKEEGIVRNEKSCCDLNGELSLYAPASASVIRCE